MKKLPWYLNVLLWIFAICGGFFLILFIRACLLAVGILKKDTDSTAKTASNLFGLLSNSNNPNEGDAYKQTDLYKYYKLKQDYIFYGKDELKTIFTYKKDAVIQGYIVQLDANTQGNPDEIHLTVIDKKDYVKLYRNDSNVAIPLSVLTQLTNEEVVAWNKKQSMPV